MPVVDADTFNIKAESEYDGCVEDAIIPSKVVTGTINEEEVLTGTLISDESGDVVGSAMPNEHNHTNYVESNQCWVGDPIKVDDRSITFKGKLNLGTQNKEEDNMEMNNKEKVNVYDVYVYDNSGEGVEDLKLVKKKEDVHGRDKEEAGFNAKVHKIMEENDLTPSSAIVHYNKKFSLTVKVEE